MVVAVAVLELLGPLIGAVAYGRLRISVSSSLNLALLRVGVTALAVGGLDWLLDRKAGNLHARSLWSMIGAMVVMMGGFFLWQQGTLEVFWIERLFALELRATASGLAPESIAFCHNSSANMLFYMEAERLLPALRNVQQLREFVADRAKCAAITRRGFVKDASAAAPLYLGEQPDLVERSPSWATDASDDGWVAWIVSPPDDNGVRGRRQVDESQ